MHSGRHPFEVFVLAASAAAGAALQVSGTPPPASVQAAMPPVLETVWELGLIVAGVTGLIGVWWRGHPVTGLGVETLGVGALGTGMAMYTVAIAAYAGARGLSGGLFLGALAVGSWWRVAQIVRIIRRAARNQEP